MDSRHATNVPHGFKVAGRGGQSKKGEGREILEFVVRLAFLGRMRYLQQIQGGQQIFSMRNLRASADLSEITLLLP